MGASAGGRAQALSATSAHGPHLEVLLQQGQLLRLVVLLLVFLLHLQPQRLCALQPALLLLLLLCARLARCRRRHRRCCQRLLARRLQRQRVLLPQRGHLCRVLLSRRLQRQGVLLC